VERLNLGTQEQDAGDLTAALADIRAAAQGLSATSGDRSPTVQAARVAEAGVLSELGQQAQALALVDTVDPVAYQATTSDPGRAPLLRALRAQILWRMGRSAEARPQLQQALAEMQRDGVAATEQAPFRTLLAEGTAPAR
jgi:non-specific serine/threonine protein kinase